MAALVQLGGGAAPGTGGELPGEPVKIFEMGLKSRVPLPEVFIHRVHRVVAPPPGTT